MMRLSSEFALFKDRHDAGKQLAQRLLHYKEATNTIIIALPHGRVVVGSDISLALLAPFGCPDHPQAGDPFKSRTGNGRPSRNRLSAHEPGCASGVWCERGRVGGGNSVSTE
jgi:hypothetical protein